MEDRRPEAECKECAQLQEEAKQAERDRNLSKVTDCNVLLCRHALAGHPQGGQP